MNDHDTQTEFILKQRPHSKGPIAMSKKNQRVSRDVALGRLCPSVRLQSASVKNAEHVTCTTSKNASLFRSDQLTTCHHDDERKNI